MHLKICPNPQCAKISDVGVAVCEFCGQTFPKIELAPEPIPAGPAGSPAPANAPGPVTKDMPRTAVWPLIMVAIVAGGLPLLWANRSSLPTPKPWSASTPEATTNKGDASAPLATIKPPVVPELTATPTLTPIPAPPQSPADSAVPSSPAPVPTPASGVDKNKPTPSGTADNKKKAPEVPLQTGDTPKKIVKKVTKTPSAKKKEPPRPCTEAMAALGLCDPGRPGQ